MLDPNTQYEWLSSLKLLARSLLLAVTAFIVGHVLVHHTPAITSAWLRTFAILFLGLICSVAAFASMAMFAIGVIRWAALGLDVPQLRVIGTSQKDHNHLLRTISDRLLISEVAKRAINREHDRGALQNVIREDIATGDFSAAMIQAKYLSQLYGYHEEAESFREQIQAARAAEHDHKVAQAIDKLDQMLTHCEWDAADAEAAKIQRLFPDSLRTKDIQRRVDEARQKHKIDLEREFLRAAERDDVDRAMELLREMDKYLTEQEAAPFRETARGVIGRQRDNLGVQFKLAIQDKDWKRAVSVGEQIIREFPNTKMADEVRSMLDVLRTRATHQQAAQTLS